MNSKNNNLWALQSGDLPTEKLRDRYPELKELESNAVFRLLTFQTHRLGRSRALIEDNLIFILCIVTPVAGIQAIRFLTGASAIFVAIASLLGGISLIFWQHVAMLMYQRFKIAQFRKWMRKTQLDDLSSIGMSPRDFAAGLWGYELSENRLRRRYLIQGLLLFYLIVCIEFTLFSISGVFIRIVYTTLMVAIAHSFYTLYRFPTLHLRKITRNFKAQLWGFTLVDKAPDTKLTDQTDDEYFDTAVYAIMLIPPTLACGAILYFAPSLIGSFTVIGYGALLGHVSGKYSNKYASSFMDQSTSYCRFLLNEYRDFDFERGRLTLKYLKAQKS